MFKRYGPKRMGLEAYISYPLRAAKISISVRPFGFWRPSFTKRELTEFAKEQGETIWRARFAWFQISYGRWV